MENISNYKVHVGKLKSTYYLIMLIMKKWVPMDKNPIGSEKHRVHFIV